MQIDFEKMRRLELSAKDAHLLTMAASDRRDDARGKLNRKKTFLLHEWSKLPGHSRFTLLVKEHGWKEARLTAAEDFTRLEFGDGFLRSIREIEALQLELDRLAEDHQRKQSHWQKLSAPLPSLQAFAEKYGIRSEKLHGVVQGADRPAGPSIFGGAA